MKTKTLIAAFGMLMSLASISSAQQSPVFPDTPKNHWAYEKIRDLKFSIFYNIDGVPYHPRPFTRKDVAVAICTFWEYLQKYEMEKSEEVNKLSHSINAGNIFDFEELIPQVPHLNEHVRRLTELATNYPRLRDLYRAFEPEVLEEAKFHDSCRNLSLELPVRSLELTTVRYDWDTNLNLVDPADLKPEKCGREDRGKFNGLLTAAGKPVAELKKGWAGDLKLTSRIEYALATYLLHKELRGKYTKPSLQAMTTLTTEFRRELVYYFGINMYQLKSELK